MMQAAPPRRRRVYTGVDRRCEWAVAEDADTLVVDVSGTAAYVCILLSSEWRSHSINDGLSGPGFRREELKLVYNTRRRLKVAGERQVDGARWARFLKVFPVPGSCDAGAITASLDTDSSLLYVILPKGPPPPSPSSKEEERRPEISSQPVQGQEKIQGSSQPQGDSRKGTSLKEMLSRAESADAEEDKVQEEKERMEEGMDGQRQEVDGEGQEVAAIQDLRRESDADAKEDAVKGDDQQGEGKRWWEKITVLHVLGVVLVLALGGVGATILYVMLL